MEQNYQYTADYTIEKLQECLTELKKIKLDNAGPPSQNEKLKRELGIFNPDDIPVRKVKLVYNQSLFLNKVLIIKMFVQPQINGVDKKRKPINADQIHSSPEQDSQRQGEWTRL